MRVTVLPKESVLDPQGAAVRRSLHALGYDSVVDVRVGRSIDLTLEPDTVDAEGDVRRMCDELLVNGVIEAYEIDSHDAQVVRL